MFIHNLKNWMIRRGGHPVAESRSSQWSICDHNKIRATVWSLITCDGKGANRGNWRLIPILIWLPANDDAAEVKSIRWATAQTDRQSHFTIKIEIFQSIVPFMLPNTNYGQIKLEDHTNHNKTFMVRYRLIDLQ